MRDGSDAIADWPILNALLNTACGATLGVGAPRRRRRHRLLAARRHGRRRRRHARSRRKADARADQRSRHRRRATCRRRLSRSHRRRRAARAAAAHDHGRRHDLTATAPAPCRLLDARWRRWLLAGRRVPLLTRQLRQWAHAPCSCSCAISSAPGACQYTRRRARGDDARNASCARSWAARRSAADRRARGDAPPATARARRSTPRLAFLSSALHAEGAPATFLLDEVLELRTFESFPGLRSRAPRSRRRARAERQSLRAGHALHRRARTAAARRARRRFEVMHVPPLTPAPRSVARASRRTHIGRAGVTRPTTSPAPCTRSPTAAPCYVRAARRDCVDDRPGGADPVGALAALLAAGGTPRRACRFCYELRLHRARGYGALKAILDVLAEEEPLTLTEIAQRLQRTPGSTKDYLSLARGCRSVAVAIASATASPIRCCASGSACDCRPPPPSEDDIAREVQRYATSRGWPSMTHEPPPPQPPRSRPARRRRSGNHRID